MQRKEGKEKIITKDFCEGRMRVGGKEGQLVSHPSSAVVLCIQHTVDYITHCTMHRKRGRDFDLSGALPALKIDPR